MCKMAALGAWGSAAVPTRLCRAARTLWGWRARRGLGHEAGAADGTWEGARRGPPPGLLWQTASAPSAARALRGGRQQSPGAPEGRGEEGSGTGWVCRRWREEAWGAAAGPSPEGSGGWRDRGRLLSPRPAPAAASPPCGLTACEILPQREKPPSLPLRMKRFRICSTK